MEDIFYLEGEVEKFEDKFAVVKISDGQKLNWPIKNLPEDAKVGSKVKLLLTTEAVAEVEREKMAKTILNQILKTDNQNEK